jgi:hypothetical protein
MIVENGAENMWHLGARTTYHMLHDIEPFVTYNKWGKGNLCIIQQYMGVYVSDNTNTPNN